MERERKQGKGGMRRRWSITTKVQENINCEVTTIKVNVKPRGCLRFSVFTRLSESMLAAVFSLALLISFHPELLDLFLTFRWQTTASIVFNRAKNFLFAAESAQSASQLESSLGGDGFVGVWKSAGGRRAVQVGHPVAGRQRRQCAVFDLLHELKRSPKQAGYRRAGVAW